MTWSTCAENMTDNWVGNSENSDVCLEAEAWPRGSKSAASASPRRLSTRLRLEPIWNRGLNMWSDIKYAVIYTQNTRAHTHTHIYMYIYIYIYIYRSLYTHVTDTHMQRRIYGCGGPGQMSLWTRPGHARSRNSQLWLTTTLIVWWSLFQSNIWCSSRGRIISSII